MTDRIGSLTVALENDIRDDDTEAIIAAISHLRGVLCVTGNVVDGGQWLAEQRARNDLLRKILDAIKE